MPAPDSTAKRSRNGMEVTDCNPGLDRVRSLQLLAGTIDSSLF